jgi:hypothetical protein
MGKTYFTNQQFGSAAEAQQQLSLPQAPQIQVEFQLDNSPTLIENGSPAKPLFGQPGGGQEFSSFDNVKVRIKNVKRLP